MAERGQVLVDLCGDDGSLRSRVEQLVDSFESAGSFLSAAGDENDLIGSNTLAAGTNLGGYRIIRAIARGGQGIVYEGEQDLPARRVAIKTIDPTALTAVARRRFKQEVEAMGRLEHPGIARIYSADRAVIEGETILYLAMEFVDGSDIITHANERLLDLRGRVALFEGVCDAMAYAHERSVIHRDLKPGNIFVAGDGTPKVLDFGLARLTADASSGAGVTTMSSRELIGTLPYMSPEQTRMQSVDTRADVYALGALLYELLTGYMAHAVAGCPLAEALHRIRNEDTLDARSINRRIPADLNAIVQCALAKETERRYLTAGDLRDDVRRFLNGQSIIARRSTRVERAARFCRRNKGLVAAVAAIMTALSAGLGVSLWQLARAQHAESVAVTRAADLREFATTVIFDIHDAIEYLPGATKAQKLMVEKAIAFLDRVSADTDQKADADWLLIAEAYIRVGDVQGNNLVANLGDVEGARKSYGRSLEILRRVMQRNPTDEAQFLLAKVKTRPIYTAMEMGTQDYSDQGLYMTYLRSARDSLTDLATRLPRIRVGPDLIVAHWQLAIGYWLRGDRALCDESFLQALDLGQDLHRLFPESSEVTRAYAEAAFYRGNIWFQAEEYEDAAAYIESALSILASMPDAPVSSYVLLRTTQGKEMLAVCQAAKGDEKAMVETLDEARAIASRLTRLDPDNQPAFRQTCVIPEYASNGYRLLAARVGTTDAERLRLFRLARESMIEAHDLTIERDRRGWLPFWEQHYLADQANILTDLDEMLRAIASKTVASNVMPSQSDP